MKKADHQMIQRVLDGSISREGFASFQRRMRGEPELARLYGEYALLHHSLCEEYEDKGFSKRPVTVSRTVPAAGIWLLALAAVLVLLVALFYRKPSGRTGPPPVTAALRFSADAVWKIESSPQDRGLPAELTIGSTLRLIQGQATVTPSSGASALIEGPSSLTLVSPNSLYLADGRGRFSTENSGGTLEVTTPSISAVDLGTEFAIETRRDYPDELHVFDGKVRLRVNGNSEGHLLTTGEAARVDGADGIDRLKADPSHFAKSLSDFPALVDGPFLKGQWRADFGKPSISADRIEGENYTLFMKLRRPVPDAASPVMLATLSIAEPVTGSFHTDGWAGLSFFRGSEELLFFGDSFGPEKTWSLDVKQRIPVILPGQRLVGPRTVTLRFDRRNGAVSLHEGGIPLGPAFCEGRLADQLTFDGIRIGASSSAALAVSSRVIRAGGR